MFWVGRLSYLLDNLISAGFKDFYLVIGYKPRRAMILYLIIK